jgi:hypothetical protein
VTWSDVFTCSKVKMFALQVKFAMPESREEHGHYIVFDEKYQSLKGKTSFQLLGIHADASKPEEKYYDAKDGHVIQLSPDCNIARGTCGLQSYVWPHKFARTVENPNPLPINTLTLCGLHSSNRAIILDFDTYFLKVVRSLHISMNFISKSIYFNPGCLPYTYINSILLAGSLDGVDFGCQ